MALVEEGDDFIARLEARDVRADGDDGACAVRTRDNGRGEREGVFALWDDEVAVVEGYALDCWCVLISVDSR